jgi:hypothetical protein
MKPIFLLAVLVLFFQSTQAQILKKLKESKPLANLTEGKKPITTNFNDVDVAGTLDPSFGEKATFLPLHSMKKNDKGNYELPAGYYQVTNLSYCLKAGTNGPAKGDAYGLAFLEGKMDDIVEAILVKSQQMWGVQVKDTSGRAVALLASNALKVSQKDVQLLLWAIIAKTNFENMGGRTKAVALALLTPDQIVKLNGGAVKAAFNFASDKGFVDKPQWMQKIEEAEHNLRSLYARGDATYEDFERLAVVAGMASEPNPVEAGTWFKHEDGFYVRFEPEGYPRTTIKVYVPEGKTVQFKATTMVATPSDSRQRLAQTDTAVEEYKRHSF